MSFEIEVESADKPATCYRCRRSISYGEEFLSQLLTNIDGNQFEIAWHTPKCPTSFEQMVTEQLSDGLNWVLNNHEACNGRTGS